MRWAPPLLLALLLTACSGSGPAPTATPSVATPTSSPTATIRPTIAPTATPTPTVPPIDAFLLACPPAADVAAINAALPLFFDSDPTAPTLVCRANAGSADLTLMQRRVYNILRVMQRLNFAKPLPWTDKQLYTWFVGAVKGISFRGDTTFSSCCKPEHVIIIPTAANSFLLQTDRWIENDGAAGAGGLRDTLLVFAHEARHSEGGFPHSCGPNNSIDPSLTFMGGYAMQYYLDLYLSAYSGDGLFPKAYQDNSASAAERTRTTRFCDQLAPAPSPTSARR